MLAIGLGSAVGSPPFLKVCAVKSAPLAPLNRQLVVGAGALAGGRTGRATLTRAERCRRARGLGCRGRDLDVGAIGPDLVGHVAIPTPTQKVFAGSQACWYQHLILHLPVVGIVNFGPCVACAFSAEVLGKLLLDQVITK